jgi:hypothetical protein
MEGQEKDMEKRLSYGLGILTVFAALMALLLAVAAPALAASAGNGHDKDKKHSSTSSDSTTSGDRDGDADSDSGTQYDEDNDTNDGGTDNNVADDGDNAHPSGKDRSVEHGNAAKNPNQGKSESDPDGDENGGRDKANGSGGDDLADQDGNNGCGNDDDFEDDNNGNCGKHKDRSDDAVKPSRHHSRDTDEPCDEDDNMANGVQPCNTDEDEEEVLPGVVQAPAKPLGESVLGLQISRNPAARPGVLPARAARAPGAVLPFTGTNALLIALIGLGMIASGALVVGAVRK